MGSNLLQQQKQKNKQKNSEQMNREHAILSLSGSELHLPVTSYSSTANKMVLERIRSVCYVSQQQEAKQQKWLKGKK